MKKLIMTLLIMAVIVVITGCDKNEHKDSPGNFPDEKLEIQEMEIAEAPIVMENNDTFTAITEESDEKDNSPSSWTYSFPVEYLQESTTDKYFSRNDWYEKLVYGITNLTYLMRPEGVSVIRIYASEDDSPFYYEREYSYSDGVEIMWKDRVRDTMDDGYIIYDELGRIQRIFCVDLNVNEISSWYNYCFSYSYNEEENKLICRKVGADGHEVFYEEIIDIKNPNRFQLIVKESGKETVYEKLYSDTGLILTSTIVSDEKNFAYKFTYDNDTIIEDIYDKEDYVKSIEIKQTGDTGKIIYWKIINGIKELEYEEEIIGYDLHGNWLQLNARDSKYKREILYN